ncbi:MAG: hypothetical protein ACRCWQ_05745 [Bacilli bacterium]
MVVILSEKLKISSITHSDVDKIVALLKEHDMNYGSVKLHVDHFLKVESDEAIIGCVALIPREGFSEIKSLLVDERNRSFTVFNQICKALALKSSQHHHTLIGLKVDQHNPAILLYKRKKFTPLTEKTHPNIYRILMRDCTICHSIVQPICNPTYYILDLEKNPVL